MVSRSASISIGAVSATLMGMVLEAFGRGEDWKLLFWLFTVPAAVVLLGAMRFLCQFESPRWTLVSRTQDDLKRLLAGVGGGAGESLPPIGLQQKEQQQPGRIGASGTSILTEKEAPEIAEVTMEVRFSDLVGEWKVMVFGIMILFCSNFAAQGGSAWLGVFMKEQGLIRFNFTSYMFVELGDIAGKLVAWPIGDRVGRLRCLQIGFLVGALSTFAFILPFPADLEVPLLMTLVFFQGSAAGMLWSIIYLYLLELFPTTIRSTA